MKIKQNTMPMIRGFCTASMMIDFRLPVNQRFDKRRKSRIMAVSATRSVHSRTKHRVKNRYYSFIATKMQRKNLRCIFILPVV